MARLAVPNREVILAMEELGLLGWLPNRRWPVRSRGVRVTVEPMSDLAASKTAGSASPWMNVLGGVTVAASLITLGGGLMSATDGPRAPSAARVMRTLGAALACGVGLLGAWALMKIGGARRAPR